jgi:hypothetical protein
MAFILDHGQIYWIEAGLSFFCMAGGVTGKMRSLHLYIGRKVYDIDEVFCEVF